MSVPYKWLFYPQYPQYPEGIKAQGRRKPKPGLLHHSDRGSQYASHDYRNHLAIKKMEQGMGRKGNCWEGLPLGYNSPTERFFRSLKRGQLNYERFRSKASAELSVIDVWPFYNGKRSLKILET